MFLEEVSRDVEKWLEEGLKQYYSKLGIKLCGIRIVRYVDKKVGIDNDTFYEGCFEINIPPHYPNNEDIDYTIDAIPDDIIREIKLNRILNM